MRSMPMDTMDTWLPPMNPEVARLRRQSAQRKYRKRLRNVRALWTLAFILLLLLFIEVLAALCFSPRFWIYRIDVTGNETLTQAEVVRLVNLRPHSNFYRTSLGKLAERVKANPRVEDADVRRSAIGVLLVEVKERQAVCRLGYTEQPLYVDAGKFAFTRPIAPNPQVPVVENSGIQTAPALIGTKVKSDRLDAVLACMQALRDAAPGHTPIKISRIEFDQHGWIKLVLQQGTKIFIGRPQDLPAKIWVMHQTIALQNGRGHSLDKLDYIDVRTVNKPGDWGFVKVKSNQEAVEP
ncbi:MAG: cell division protein FtsQ/DivIB [Armatimonadota bacterium]